MSFRYKNHKKKIKEAPTKKRCITIEKFGQWRLLYTTMEREASRGMAAKRRSQDFLMFCSSW